MAIPRGSALGSLSGIWGIPVLLLKRTETGVDGAWKCGALESFAASEVGVKVPVRRTPFACAEGKVSEAEEYLGGRQKTDLVESLDACRRWPAVGLRDLRSSSRSARLTGEA